MTAKGPKGDSWDAGDVLVLALLVGTWMFNDNSLSGIFMQCNVLSVCCIVLSELCESDNIQPF